MTTETFRKIYESLNYEDLESTAYATGQLDLGSTHIEWQTFMKGDEPFVKLNQTEISQNRWNRDTFFCELWNMTKGQFSMGDIQKLSTHTFYEIKSSLEQMANVYSGKYNTW